MKIVIVGSKGFIGHHAKSYFSREKGYECWGCDVVVDYTDPQYILLDATNSDFNEMFETNEFDVCINCSGAASVPDSLIHPVRDFTLNSYNVVKMLDAIRRHTPHCKFINLSSAAVYGNPKRLPILETDECAPVSPYGMHKWFAEKVVEEYHSFYNLKTCSVRIFSAYGEGLKKQLLWDLFQKSMQNQTLVMFGTGNETRDFIHFSDILQAIHLIIERGEYSASVYNIANGVGVSVREVAERLMYWLQYKGVLTFSGSNRAGDPLYWKADISKIQSLGYVQKVSIEQGINQYIQWIKEEKLG